MQHFQSTGTAVFCRTAVFAGRA